MRTYVRNVALSIYGTLSYHKWQEHVHFKHSVSYLANVIIFLEVFYIFGLSEYSYELIHLCRSYYVTTDAARLT